MSNILNGEQARPLSGRNGQSVATPLERYKEALEPLLKSKQVGVEPPDNEGVTGNRPTKWVRKKP